VSDKTTEALDLQVFKPSDGLEPSTPSLPCAAKRLPWVASGCGSACLSGFRARPICHRLPPVAPAGLHKCSTIRRESLMGKGLRASRLCALSVEPFCVVSRLSRSVEGLLPTSESYCLSMRLATLVAAILCLVAGVSTPASRPATSFGSCSAEQTRQLVNDFVAAFSNGDYARLDALFAPPAVFAWFSSNNPGPRTDAQARERRNLIPYFRDRHAWHDSLVLLAFDYNGAGNFSFTLRRQASDYAQGRAFRLDGKGAARCSASEQRFIVISLGGPSPDTPVGDCNVSVANAATRAPRPVPRSFNFGNATIAVALSPANGHIVAGKLPGGGVRATIRTDGKIDAKVGWWRAGERLIRITGHRLDAIAPRLTAHVPEGYSRGFQATGLHFPTPGCWRVTGSYAGRSLSFTVLVTLSPLGP
jgi:hypothetical protein